MPAAMHATAEAFRNEGAQGQPPLKSGNTIVPTSVPGDAPCIGWLRKGFYFLLFLCILVARSY